MYAYVILLGARELFYDDRVEVGVSLSWIPVLTRVVVVYDVHLFVLYCTLLTYLLTYLHTLCVQDGDMTR